MRDTLEFIRAAIRRPLEVSTVFPTSQYLARRLLDATKISEAKSVVELGPGTGAITKYLRPRLNGRNGYLGIEVDPPMVGFLRREYSDLRFEIGLAESLKDLVAAESVDVVVSSLPWTIFPSDVQVRTIDSIYRSLRTGGVFVTYVCVNAMIYPQARAFIQRLEDRFSRVRRSDLEWRNIPPAFVYTALK